MGRIELYCSCARVELAKTKLDQADLFSPVEGIVVDDSNITSGLYVTPSLSSFKILETASLYFEIKIKPEEILSFVNSRKGKLNLPAIKKSVLVDSQPFFSSGKDFFVRLNLTDKKDIFWGLKGKVIFP